MSKPFIFRDGTVVTTPFAATLGEIAMPASPKKRSTHDMAAARQAAIELSKEEGFELGRQQGVAIGQTAGYQAGFDQAYAEGSNKHAETLREFAAELQTVHERLEESIAEWFRASETELEILGVQIAERLIAAQLNLDRSFVIETTKAAMLQMTEASRARIRVNPFDSVILSNSKDEIMAASASLRGIEIVDDASIYGGCVIETERGAVDATIETRLEILSGGLEEAA